LEESHAIATAEKLTPQYLERGEALFQYIHALGYARKPTSISKQFQCDRVFLQWLGKIGYCIRRCTNLSQGETALQTADGCTHPSADG